MLGVRDSRASRSADLRGKLSLGNSPLVKTRSYVELSLDDTTATLLVGIAPWLAIGNARLLGARKDGEAEDK